jgi:GNAT superfamily N-acetyltransferase
VLTTSSGVRVLGGDDVSAFLELTARDPVVNVFAEYRARTTGLDRRWLGGEVLGRYVDGELVAALHVGANVVPVQAGPEDLAELAEHPSCRRTFSSMVGPHTAVQLLWGMLEHELPKAREVRMRQPHLEISGPPAVVPDPRLRRTTPSDMDALYPACVAFYTEEIGISPEYGGGRGLYRARVEQMVSRGWSFASFDDDGRVVFKAEIACASPSAAQIQGVYVAPELRGQGLGAAGMAAVVNLVHEQVAPVASLYVNDWNLAARRTYERVGFVETARFSTVML